MLSAIMGQVGNWIHDWATSAWKQDKAEGMMEDAQNFNATEAAVQRQWLMDMSGSAYQRATKDMQAAGLNPMLAYSQGGASTPGAAAAHIGGAPAPGFNNSSAANLALTEATIDKTRAEAGEIRARTPTHQVSIDKTRQDIAESVERIQKIQQDVRTGTASAAQLTQQTRNLQEMVPQIQATVQQLRTLSTLQDAKTWESYSQANLTQAQISEIQQRIKQNLPHLEAVLKQLERQARELQIPGRTADAAAADSFVGQLGSYLRAINPLKGFLDSIR